MPEAVSSSRRAARHGLAVCFVLVVVLAVATPALASSWRDNNSGGNKDFAGLVEIGGGRDMYLECHGKGSPTVVFVSGAGDRAETWSTTKDPSEKAVLPAIAETNRVCAYDRPGTVLAVGDGAEDFETSRSDPVPQPTTLQDGAPDLSALISASGERGPYVVVGHSMGGAIARLYASDYPREVSGLVLVDYTPYQARNSLTDKQWGYWKGLLGSPSEEALALYPDLERFDHVQNLEEALAADPLKPMPLIVLSSDEPYDLAPFVESGVVPADMAERLAKKLFRVILEARVDLVSQIPGARHITNTDSGHYIHQEQPQLVIDSVRDVVNAVRQKAWCKKGHHNALGYENRGQCVKAMNHSHKR